MGSQIDAILDAIEAMTITGYPATVYRGATLKDTVEVADLPVRIISTIGMSSARGRAVTLGTGHVMQAEWTITDVALLRAAGMGIGLKDVAPSMEGYMAAYHQAVRSLVSSAWAVTTVQTRGQVLEWPQASGRFYDVVISTLTVSDIIQ